MPPLSELLHARRHRPRWRALLAVLVGVVSWFAFTPRPPDVLPMTNDKVRHVLAFGALGTTAALGAAAGATRAAAVAAALLAYGGFIEVVQSQLPPRQAEWTDLVADAAGIAGGLLLAGALRRAWPARPGAPGGRSGPAD